jgi:hypothetical protein
MYLGKDLGQGLKYSNAQVLCGQIDALSIIKYVTQVIQYITFSVFPLDQGNEKVKEVVLYDVQPQY